MQDESMLIFSRDKKTRNSDEQLGHGIAADNLTTRINCVLEGRN